MANVTFIVGAVDNASGVLGRVHSSLRNILQITAGNLIADGIRRIGMAAGDMFGEMVRGAGVFQNLQLKFENMVARIMAADANRNSIQTVYSMERIQLSANEAEALDTVTQKYNLAIAQLPVMQERLQAMADSGNYSAAALELQAVKIEQLQQKIQGWGAEIDNLQGKNGALVQVATQIQTSTFYTKDFMEEAKQPAKELMDWVLGMAMQSKFTAESMSQVMGYALSMKMPPDFEKGLSSLDRAKELVTAVGNFSAGMGLDNNAIERIMYNFTQMSAAGKVTGRDLRDLATSLFPAQDAFDTLAQMMGVTREQAEKLAKSGEVDVTKFFDAFVQVAKRDFPDAMARTSRTIDAAMSNVKEFITTVLGAKVFGPLFQRLGGQVADFIAKMITPESIAKFEKLGIHLDGMLQTLGLIGGSAIREAGELITKIADALGITIPNVTIEDVIDGIAKAIAGFLTGARDMSTWLAENPKFIEIFTNLKTTFETLQSTFEALGGTLPPVTVDLGTLANLSFDTINTALKALNDNLKNLNDFIASGEGGKMIENLKQTAIAFAIIAIPIIVVLGVLLVFTAIAMGAASGIIALGAAILATVLVLVALFMAVVNAGGAIQLIQSAFNTVILIFGAIAMGAIWLIMQLDILWVNMQHFMFNILISPLVLAEWIANQIAKAIIGLLEYFGIVKHDVAEEMRKVADSMMNSGIGHRLQQLGNEFFDWVLKGMKNSWETLATWVNESVGWLLGKVQEAADALAKLLGLQSQAEGTRSKAGTQPSSPNVAPGSMPEPSQNVTPQNQTNVTVILQPQIHSEIDVERLAYRTAKEIVKRL